MKIADNLSPTNLKIVIGVLISLIGFWCWESYYYRAQSLVMQQLAHGHEQISKSQSSTQALYIPQSLQLLTQQLAQAQQQLQQSKNRIVLGPQMLDLMKSLTQTFPGIQLTALQNDDAKKTKDTGMVKGLYRHYFSLSVTGNYAAVTQYLHYLETLPWHLYWEKLDYQVIVYPNAKVMLSFYVYSPKEFFLDA